jgi:hypothetical protein
MDGLPRPPSGTSSRSRGKGRQPFKMNPFRKKDEIELLRRRTHNRRRWSHVFPQGIAEFKRHAFINWTSLCQPAILPLTTDFFPTEAVLREEFLEVSEERDKNWKKYRVTKTTLTHSLNLFHGSLRLS